MTTTEIQARRVLDNLQRADFDPSGNCFIASRAIEILMNGGELLACEVDGNSHVIYRGEDGCYYDVTADGVGESNFFGASELPESYSDLVGYEWPVGYTKEFAADLAILTRPNGGGI